MSRVGHLRALTRSERYMTVAEFLEHARRVAVGGIMEPRPGLRVEKTATGLIFERGERTRRFACSR